MISIILFFSLGTVISGAIFSFIAMIGVVPRLARKTKTQKHIKLYEEVIAASGIAGAGVLIFNFTLPLPSFIVLLLSVSAGIFLGCLAVSLTEVLDVLPITMRRANVKVGLTAFIFALAFGKVVGSLMYFLIEEFAKIGG